jgi:hypothetical protein
MIAGGTVELVRTSQDDAVAIQRLTRKAYAKWVPIIGCQPKPMTVDYAEAVMLFDICYADKLVPVLPMPEKPIPNGTRAGQIPKPRVLSRQSVFNNQSKCRALPWGPDRGGRFLPELGSPECRSVPGATPGLGQARCGTLSGSGIGPKPGRVSFCRFPSRRADHPDLFEKPLNRGFLIA